MELSYATLALYVIGALVAGILLSRLRTRLELSRAKHRSLAGHARWSRRLAKLIPFYEFDEARFFRADEAPDDVARKRQAGFARLSQLYRERFAKTRAQSAEARDGVSDMQFT